MTKQRATTISKAVRLYILSLRYAVVPRRLFARSTYHHLSTRHINFPMEYYSGLRTSRVQWGDSWENGINHGVHFIGPRLQASHNIMKLWRSSVCMHCSHDHGLSYESSSSRPMVWIEKIRIHMSSAMSVLCGAFYYNVQCLISSLLTTCHLFA